MSNQISENKLTLLYLIREKDNITSEEIYDFILFRNREMDYFLVQSCLAELEENKLILRIEMKGKTYYTLLPEGDEIVEIFRTRIPNSVREDIRLYAENSYMHGSPLLEVSSTLSEKQNTANGEYIVGLNIMDYNKSVLALTVNAESREAAERIQRNWAAKGMNIYWNMLKELKNDSEEGKL